MDADARQAVETARRHLEQLFTGEKISDVGLEEVEFDDKSLNWKITISFARPWDQKLTASLGARNLGRSYKVVQIKKDGSMVSIKDRLLIGD